MVCPHATCAGDWLHRGAHTHAPALQICPEGHRVPVPAQVCPAHTLGMLAPQVTVLADGQLGTHSHIRVVELQRCPEGHCVPCPGQVKPAQRFWIDAPHITLLADGQLGAHSHMRAVVLQR